MLCLHAPVFTLADKQSLGIHYSPPPPSRLGVDPMLPHAIHRCLATLLHHAPLSSPSVLRQQAHMSLSSGHSQGIQAWTQSPSTPPRGPQGHPRASHARSGQAACGVEWRWTMSRGEGLMMEQNLYPDQSIWSHQISWSLLVTSEWNPL